MGLFRDIIVKSIKTFKDKLASHQEVQQLLDQQHIKMAKTKEYEADDHQGMTAWSYRFTFDSPARKRNFLQAIGEFPPQEWDKYVRWMNDISNFNGEICVEAFCKVPPEEVGKFRYQFERFATRELVIKGV